MFFSIIVPVYNTEKFIRKCLDSIVSQSFRNYELILVDDGSTDGSGKICDEYAAHYGNIKVIHKENGGLADARNAGLKVAKGDWIWFVDSDDYIATDAFEKLYGYVTTSEPADMYVFNAWRVDENSVPYDRLIFRTENEYVSLKTAESKLEYLVNRLLVYYDGWESCFRLYKSDLIEKNGLFFENISEIFAEDLLFTAKYFLNTDSVLYVCNLFYYYRKVGTSLSNNMDQQNMLAKLNALAESLYQPASRIKALRTGFYRIYYTLLNFHITFKLDELTDDEIRAKLNELNTRKHHRKWMKKAEKNGLRLNIERKKWDQ